MSLATSGCDRGRHEVGPSTAFDSREAASVGEASKEAHCGEPRRPQPSGAERRRARGLRTSPADAS